MTSNKHKRSSPHKSPQKPSLHKPHKSHKSDKSSQEKVKPLTPNSSNCPILPPKYVRAARPILPPTRRILFPQNAKESNNQQPFSSSPPVGKDHSKTGKHTLSSPAAKPSDDRPFKKQCLSSPPAKKDKFMSRESNGVDWRAGMNISSDDKDEEGTPSPPSRKRKADVIAGAGGRQKKPAASVAAPPKPAVSVTSPEQYPSPISTFQHNSTAINKIDITVLRLEKEELQKHLDTSIQQAQQAKSDVKKWETKYKATIDTQETLDRLLNVEMKEKETLQNRIDTFTQQAHELKLAAETWEERWKVTSEENNSLRKQLASKTKEHDTAEFNREQWQLQHRIQIDKNAKLQRELKLKQVKNRCEKEPYHFANKVIQLEQEISQLKSQNAKMSHKKEREEYLEATNRLLAKQVAQLKEEIQHKSTLEKQATKPQEEVRHSPEDALERDIRQQDNNNSAKEIAQVRETPPKPHQESSPNSTLPPQTSQTHPPKPSTLHHQNLTHLTTQLTNSQQELLTLQQAPQTQTHKIQILISEHENEVEGLKEEIQKLESVNKYKDLGLEKMGLLVAGWALKWRGLGGGKMDGNGNGIDGKIPGVEGLGVRVNGMRM